MNSYIITGAKRTGEDVRIQLQAPTEADARAAAVAEGILITECKVVGHENSIGNRTESYLHEIAMWLRFFGITTSIVIFALILRTIMSK